MRRANILPALTLMLASLVVLFVGSNAAASTSPHFVVPAAIQPMQVHRAARQLSFVSPKHGASSGAHHSIAQSKPKAPADSGTAAAQSSASDGSTSSPANVSVAVSVQLTPGQTSCQQGQTVYTISSALVTLPVATADGTITWYWETRIDSGTNPSDMPPIANMSSSSSQQITAGQTQITLTGDQSQPLLAAPAGTTYAYSFRLHAAYNMTDSTSDWISVPQDSGACSQTN